MMLVRLGRTDHPFFSWRHQKEVFDTILFSCTQFIETYWNNTPWINSLKHIETIVPLPPRSSVLTLLRLARLRRWTRWHCRTHQLGQRTHRFRHWIRHSRTSCLTCRICQEWFRTSVGPRAAGIYLPLHCWYHFVYIETKNVSFRWYEVWTQAQSSSQSKNENTTTEEVQNMIKIWLNLFNQSEPMLNQGSYLYSNWRCCRPARQGLNTMTAERNHVFKTTVSILSHSRPYIF